MTPAAAAVAAMLLAGGVAAYAPQAQAAQGNWFAGGNSAVRSAQRPVVPGAVIPNAVAQRQQANAQLTRSITNLNRTANVIAAQQAAQQAARNSAQGGVPDGLAEGGLKLAAGAADNALKPTQVTDAALWNGADLPTVRSEGGRQVVDIRQTKSRAILNWDSFNVGRNTTVNFDQRGGSANGDANGASNWAVLNRVVGADTKPSQIQGAIQAQGTVMVVNQNGVVFSNGSQVNVRNLVAASAKITDAQFNGTGLYADTNGTPTFTEALGAIRVEQGARITTQAPGGATQGGGYVLLAGAEVHNAGEISTPRGQVALAAGDSFVIRRGVGTDGNLGSTTRGNEITARVNAGSTAGAVSNTGLLQAAMGDVTLTGHRVEQAGVVLASTSVDARGTVHLNAVNRTAGGVPSAQDAGLVTLAEHSVSAVLADTGSGTALDSQRDGLMKPGIVDTSTFTNVPVTLDRGALSLVEIRSAGDVDFRGDSLTLATGGQILVEAAGRSLVRDRAELDVSGAVGVKLDMASNSIKINIQGNEQRDAPVSRDDGSLNNTDVWVDVRDLVHVAAGVNGYANERWYTPGGLLEVGGYLGTRARGIGEWLAQGGTVAFAGGEVVTQAGSIINLSGGTLDVQDGMIRQSWLRGADGRLYEVSRAPGDLRYEAGVYRGYEITSARWGATRLFHDPLGAPSQRFEAGYTVGRDAGRLVIGTASAVLEGELVGESYQGPRQTQAPSAGVDGFLAAQTQLGRRGQLIVGNYVPYYLKATNKIDHALGTSANHIQDVVFTDDVAGIAAGLELGTALDETRKGQLLLDTALLNGAGLGGIDLSAQRVTVDADLALATGGTFQAYANDIAVNADLVAHGGSIVLANVLPRLDTNGLDTLQLANPENIDTRIVLASGARLDASGLWTNQATGGGLAGMAARNGGTVSLVTDGTVTLEAGSLVDVSSGAVLRQDGSLAGGRGGDVALRAGLETGVGLPTRDGRLALAGELRGLGVTGGGTLALQADAIQVGGVTPAADEALWLDAGFFDKGFSAYDLTANRQVAVAEGAVVDVTMPVLRQAEGALAVASGAGGEGAALVRWLPELYQGNPETGVMTQRAGASLHMQAGSQFSRAVDVPDMRLSIGQGAVVSVDPGQRVSLASLGQLDVDGRINAWGGDITLKQVAFYGETEASAAATPGHNRSLRVGAQAVLDVSARAATLVDARGRRYGLVADGGRITVGGELNPETGLTTGSDQFVLVEQGARLEASGAQAVLDLPAQGVTHGGRGSTQATDIAGNGGHISLASLSGLYVEGDLIARAGGAGAAGGTLSIGLDSGVYPTNLSPSRVRAAREMIVTRDRLAAGAPGTLAGVTDGELAYGNARVSASLVEAGGFDALELAAPLLSFADDVTLSLGRSLSLYAANLGLSTDAADTTQVRLAAPVVRLAGHLRPGKDAHVTPFRPGTPVASKAGDADLTVNAGLIDLRDQVALGSGPSASTPVDLERRGFARVILHSTGDLRLLKATAGVAARSTLAAGGLLDLRAAQIYPATHAVATLSAAQIDIGRATPDTPAMPDSVFGSLVVDAPIVNQGGVLRAPLGSLSVGISSGYGGTLDLLPGSLTSVSAAGLLMPYGGTVDGVVYSYNGAPLGTLLTNQEMGRVTLQGELVTVAPGAVVDISGGGELTGAGFVSGRGGSTDARFHPLMHIGPDGFVLPALSDNPVYAIVPGTQRAQAPTGEAGASQPLVGQQITLRSGVAGLPAGTYTLLPSTYALLPGAFRVEIPTGDAGVNTGTVALRNGSFATQGVMSLAGTSVRAQRPSSVILTPADVLRTYSQYNETGFGAFLAADAARLGVPAVLLPQDGKRLRIELKQPVYGQDWQDDVFNFDGLLRSDGGQGGQRGITEVDTGINIVTEIVAAGGARTEGFTGQTLRVNDLNAIAAGGLSIGGRAQALYGQGGNQLAVTNSAKAIHVREGAVLRAPSVFLIAGGSNSVISVEQGAGIITLGQGAATQDSARGYIFSPGKAGILAVSNGTFDILSNTAYSANSPNDIPAEIRLGVCGTACGSATQIYAEGAIAMATYRDFELSDAVRYGARHLSLAVGGINAGTAQAMEAARAAGTLPAGLTLNQDLLDRLLRGDTDMGAPALETLTLTAREAMRFYGNVTLDTYNAAGTPLLKEFVLTTPALYGAGAAGDVVTLRTSNLIWNGSTEAPSAVVRGGAGDGDGILNIDAETITLGYSARAQTQPLDEHARVALGFSTVNLMASDRITGNHRGTLAVHHKQGAFDGKAFAYTGGDLNLVTPMLTGEAGAVTRISASGALRASTGGGVIDAAAVALAHGASGAELALSAQELWVDTNVVLPSGKLSLEAEQDITLADGAQLDLAGRAIAFDDVTRYSWGGNVDLESRHGNVTQAGGSRIDVSARQNNAGTLKVVALDGAAGTVALQGQILGGATGHYDAGGTNVPYRAGGVEIRAQNLGGPLDAEFAALNTRLNAGEVFGARDFQFKQGSLVIGDGLKAGEINVSVDGGSLTVNGLVDASGERVGVIRLAGKQGLTLAGTAVLDAHGSVLRVDSYGKIIESPNRAIVELRSGDGALTLGDGVHIDLRHGTAATTGAGAGQHDGRRLGTLSLYAPRIDAQGRPTDLATDNDPSVTPDAATHGDVAIDARGNVRVDGAKAIALYAVQRDDKAPDSAGNAASGKPYQEITQDYLNDRHDESTLFINAALANGALMNGKLAGLNNATYRDVFHLRPGLELISKTADGDLIVQGDLDLSGHRYASINPTVRGYVAGALSTDAAYGAGESGSLSIRAGGNLEVYGSINDGFVTPPVTQDDTGWLLVEGKQPFGGDVVVPGNNVVLQPGTAFEHGKVLNYDLPINGTTLVSGTLLPIDVTLAGSTTIAAGTVLGGAIYHADGSVAHAAGSLLAADVTLTANMKLGAGMRLTSDTSLAAMRWPAGVALPRVVVASTFTVPTVILSEALALKPGSFIPSQTDVKLLGGETIALRTPDADGNHGRNWALAQMLPAGSQSWSIQLVGGADRDAADPRLTNPATQAMLRLSDTHYGKKALPAGIMIWSFDGAADMGIPEQAGKPIDFDWLNDEMGWPTLCDDVPLHCESASYIWTEFGATDMGDPSLAGQPISFTTGPAAYWDTFCTDVPTHCAPASEGFETVRGGSRTSVVRTGTGDLELVSAGDVRIDSLYGVYTAGMSTPVDAAFNQPRGRAARDQVQVETSGGYESFVDGGANSLYQAWYPDHGGNVHLSSGGNLTGDILANLKRYSDSDFEQSPSSAVGNWLWRQGTGNALSAANSVPTAWWINFGTYVPTNETTTGMVGFTGIGALGGGNVDVRVAGDAGMLTPRGDHATQADQMRTPRSQGLVLAIGSTGRVGQDGTIHLTGGGDLALRVGGAINPVRNSAIIHDLQGAIVNLRGETALQAAAVGGIGLQYGSAPLTHDSRETRSFDAYTATRGAAARGLILVPGDSTMTLSTRGDLVLGAAADAGRVTQRQSQAFTLDNGTQIAGGGSTWFSLWTPHTAIDLFSAGGNVTPGTQIGQLEDASRPGDIRKGEDASPSDGRVVFPSILRVVAAEGSIYYGSSAFSYAPSTAIADSLVLAPSPRSELSFLARESIYGSGYVVSASSADEAVLATPLRPGFVGTEPGYLNPLVTNQGTTARVKANLNTGRFPLFAFGDDAPAGNSSNTAAHFYAVNGDIIGLRTGERILFRDGSTFHVGAGPVRILAGRDIVNSGTTLGQPTAGSTYLDGALESYGNLFVHNTETDVSMVTAGRDILYSSFEVAGPGTLAVSAGRHIRMDDRASVVSLGAVAVNDTRPGASIVMMAGVGSAGPDYQAVLKRYLDPANRLAEGTALADQPGAAVKTYAGKLTLNDWLVEEHGYTGKEADAEAFLAELQAKRDADTSQPRRVLANDYLAASDLHLVNWMEARQGYAGTEQDALAAFQALAPEQQAIFARQLYYAELRAGGREYNDADSPRYGSYLRGREAIATLFPQIAPSGEPRAYQGDITMYGSAGVNTLFGGDIQMLTPGGQQIFGIEGEAPVAKGLVTPGVVTQGAGNISLYGLGSVLLGQSRIMTTFGGHILAWSAQGDINAGRGSKTTVVYTPPRRVYDAFGNVTLSPSVPSSGAGIATLAPIAEVPAGDIDLLAPLGTIDAGEAGIRVSGNVNIAALTVVNAANIQVQGDAVGIPVVAAVNVGALTNASAAASSAADAAQESVARSRAAARQNLPSIISVQILGFGDDGAAPAAPPASQPRDRSAGMARTVAYRGDAAVQVVGDGELDAAQRARYTAEERRALGM